MRGPATGLAIAFAAAVATFAVMVTAAIIRLVPLPPRPQVDVVPPPDGTWSAPWEALSQAPAVFPREALGALARTVLLLGAGALVIAALALTLHTVSRILAQWRTLAIRSALGARLRWLLADVGAGLLLFGAAGAGAGVLAGGAAVALARVAWPVVITHPPHAAVTALTASAVTAGVLTLLTVVAAALLYPLQHGVRVVADLHGEHVTARGPLLAAQSALAVLQLVVLLVVTYGCALVLESGVPAVPSPAKTPYPDSLVVTSLRWSGPDASSPLARSRAYARLDAALRGGVVGSPDAWLGMGKRLDVLSLCGDCYIGLNMVPMLAATVRVVAVSPKALTRMRLGIVRGRDLARADSLGAPRVAVLNGVAADRLFTGGDPLGKRVQASFREEDDWIVVGVTRTITARGLGTGGGEPIVFVPLLQQPPEVAEVALRRDELASLRAALATTPDARLVPVLGASVALTRRIADFDAPLGWFAGLLAVLAAAAMLVAVVALESVMTQIVVVRARDIAVRMALGASPLRILGWVAARSLRITGVGAMIGVSLARWLGEAMRADVMGSETGDLALLGALAVGFAALGVAASTRAAWRATRIQPAAAWAEPGR